jgi:hypothetical protein
MPPSRAGDQCSSLPHRHVPGLLSLAKDAIRHATRQSCRVSRSASERSVGVAQPASRSASAVGTAHLKANERLIGNGNPGAGADYQPAGMGACLVVTPSGWSIGGASCSATAPSPMSERLKVWELQIDPQALGETLQPPEDSPIKVGQIPCLKLLDDEPGQVSCMTLPVP